MTKEIKPLWELSGTERLEGESIQSLLKRAELEWEVAKQPLQTRCADRAFVSHRHYAVVRDPPGEILSIAGTVLKLNQPHEIMQYFDDFFTHANLKMLRVGSCDGGRWIWSIAKLPHEFTMGSGADLMKCYLMLAHPFICGKKTRATLVFLRNVDCSSFAIPMLKHRLSIVSSGEWGWRRITMAESVVASAKERALEFERSASELVSASLTEKEFIDMAVRFIKPSWKNEGGVYPKPILKSIRLYKSGLGSTLPTHGTRWAGLLTCCNFWDFYASEDADVSLKEAWFRHRVFLKQRAFQSLLKEVRTENYV